MYDMGHGEKIHHPSLHQNMSQTLYIEKVEKIFNCLRLTIILLQSRQGANLESILYKLFLCSYEDIFYQTVASQTLQTK